MKVLKSFHTPTRRFAAGSEVEPGDIDGKMTPEDWANKGFLQLDVVPAPEAVAEKPASKGRGAPQL